ncbi:hypothetical protein JZ751_019260, partial [Albula glossodonta]
MRCMSLISRRWDSRNWSLALCQVCFSWLCCCRSNSSSSFTRSSATVSLAFSAAISCSMGITTDRSFSASSWAWDNRRISKGLAFSDRDEAQHKSQKWGWRGMGAVPFIMACREATSSCHCLFTWSMASCLVLSETVATAFMFSISPWASASWACTRLSSAWTDSRVAPCLFSSSGRGRREGERNESRSLDV